MNKQTTSLAFAALGVTSLAVAGSCLVFIDSLGGFSYIGATLAVFLAMLCATRFGALRQAPEVGAPQAMVDPKPVAKRRKEARKEVRSPAVSAREDSEDEVIESRMAALNAAVEEEDPPSTLPPPLYEHASYFAPPEITPASSVEVIEEPLDAALAQQFAQLQSEPAPQAEQPAGPPLRQMDDIRAQIARLREESRVRHAANAARARAPMSGAYAMPVEAQAAGAPDQPKAAPAADPFARTEFSGLAGTQRTVFASTEFLAPAESPR